MSPLTWGLLAATAVVTSTISGILGMAGGITLLGVMTALLPAPQVVPLHGVVQLSSNFTRSLAFVRHIEWRIFGVFAPALLVGVALAAEVYQGTRLAWFRPAIGAFLLAFLVWRRFSPKLRNPPRWLYAVVGLVTGFLSLFVGATGPFLAPFFLRDDFDKEQVIATKAVCQTLTHLLKVPTFLFLGFDYLAHAPLLATMIAAVIVGTLLGKALLARIPKRVFTILFEGVVVALALYLIASGLAPYVASLSRTVT